MKFRELANGQRLRRPSLELDDLTDEIAAFKGDFDIDEARINGGAQVGVTGEGTLSHCLVEHVDLSEAKLAPLVLSDVLLRDVDFANALVQQATARAVEVSRCRAIGLRISLELAADLYVESSRLDYATVHFERTKGVVWFRDCSFNDATLSGDLSNVVFDGCEFAGAEFLASRAGDCDLRSAQLVGARGLASLRGAIISPVQAVSVAEQLATETGLVVRR